MVARAVRILAVAIVLATLDSCSTGSSGAPAPVQFERVELPAGDQPAEIATSGDDLLIGVHRDGQPTVPALLRRAPDGAMTDLPLTAATPYGRSAHWYSITSDGRRILAIGGDRGGAHGNVRWSIWWGTDAGAAEQPQGFSTFGGWGAGELVGAVITPAGPALVGSWQSAAAGLDVAVWTMLGDTWTRRSSAGSALESSPAVLLFATAVTPDKNGILVAGWQLGTGTGTGQAPAVWHTATGTSGWTRTALPGGGRTGAAVAARCWDAGCGVSGRVDGELALWRLKGESWTRVEGTPPVAVGDNERLAAPLEIGAHLTQFVAVDGQVQLLSSDGTATTVRPVRGPTGTVTAAVEAGRWVYLLAGSDESSQQLWRVEASTLR